VNHLPHTQQYSEHEPALRTSLLSSFALKLAQACVDWQSSLLQQHTMTGSGVGAREKLESAKVRSSMVVAALASGDSGVEARELLAASGLAIISANDGAQERSV
jgi:hypothetical protein